ncbi:hypothetical protein ACLUEY_02555 [Vreelandella aquamarina]
MHNVRRYADVVASVEGLLWLALGWSVTLSVYRGSTEPTVGIILMIATVIFVSWFHRPLRLFLRRYHVRKRRTDMWIHLLALPLLLGMAAYMFLEALLGTAWLPPKMLAVNVLASAGWLTFVFTLVIKDMIHRVKKTNK